MFCFLFFTLYAAKSTKKAAAVITVSAPKEAQEAKNLQRILDRCEGDCNECTEALFAVLKKSFKVLKLLDKTTEHYHAMDLCIEKCLKNAAVCHRCEEACEDAEQSSRRMNLLKALLKECAASCIECAKACKLAESECIEAYKKLDQKEFDEAAKACEKCEVASQKCAETCEATLKYIR